MTPNSSVFLCFDVTLQAFRTMRNFIWCLKHFNGNVMFFCRRLMTEHVKCLLLRCGILNSLSWRVLNCFSNQAVHIWLPRSVARKNNHRLGRNTREPSDWQDVGEKNLKLATRGDSWGTAEGTAGGTADLLGLRSIRSPRWEYSWEARWEYEGPQPTSWACDPYARHAGSTAGRSV